MHDRTHDRTRCAYHAFLIHNQASQGGEAHKRRGSEGQRGLYIPLLSIHPGRDPASAVPIPTATCCRVCGPPPPPAPPPHVVPGRARLRVNAPDLGLQRLALSVTPTTVQPQRRERELPFRLTAHTRENPSMTPSRGGSSFRQLLLLENPNCSTAPIRRGRTNQPRSPVPSEPAEQRRGGRREATTAKPREALLLLLR